MKAEEKKKRILSLKECIINNLKGYSFDELKGLLGNNTESIVRGAILDAMEKYFPEEFNKRIEEA